MIGKLNLMKMQKYKTEVFNPEMVQEFMNSDDFKEMETNLGLSHEVYKVEKIN